MSLKTFPQGLSLPLDATSIANGSITNTEFQYLNGVTSNIQTQFDAITAGDFQVNGNPIVQTLKVTGVDAKTATTVTIGTTIAGKKFYPQTFMCIATAANTVTLVPSISIGTNGATYNDVLANTAMTGVTAAGKYLPVPIILATEVAAATALTAKFNTQATGTTLTLTLLVTGVYL